MGLTSGSPAVRGNVRPDGELVDDTAGAYYRGHRLARGWARFAALGVYLHREGPAKGTASHPDRDHASEWGHTYCHAARLLPWPHSTSSSSSVATPFLHALVRSFIHSSRSGHCCTRNTETKQDTSAASLSVAEGGINRQWQRSVDSLDREGDV